MAIGGFVSAMESSKGRSYGKRVQRKSELVTNTNVSSSTNPHRDQKNHPDRCPLESDEYAYSLT
jgi:hypothetical protein